MGRKQLNPKQIGIVKPSPPPASPPKKEEIKIWEMIMLSRHRRFFR